MEFRSQALRLILLSVLLAWAAPAFSDITGKPRVIDGDTIEVAGQRIRLHGIDAPERGQTCDWPEKAIPCGDIAADALTGTVAGQKVRCQTQGKDRYGRWIAKCFAGDVDIGQNVVYTGWALAYRKYYMDYVSAESYAAYFYCFAVNCNKIKTRFKENAPDQGCRDPCQTTSYGILDRNPYDEPTRRLMEFPFRKRMLQVLGKIRLICWV